MKFSLREGQIPKYLSKANEIYVLYNNRIKIPDLAERYPEAEFVLEIPVGIEWDIKEIKEYSILTKDKLTLCLPNLIDPKITELKEESIPFFWGYSISTFQELKALVDFGASQARINAPIFFDTVNLKKYAKFIKLRITPNIAHEGYIPTLDGITGSWIRPEDLGLYKEIFEIVEFADCDTKKEQALYRIYAEQHAWPSEVSMLISNIQDKEAYNRMLPTTFTTRRLTCKQKCMAGSSCKACYDYFYLANPERMKRYLAEAND